MARIEMVEKSSFHGVGEAWISDGTKHPGETWDAKGAACVRRKKQPAVCRQDTGGSKRNVGSQFKIG